MITTRLVGWKKGLRTVSLVQAVKDYSTGSLASAKRVVDDLLAGRDVTLEFVDEQRRSEFRRVAAECGAVIE